jgi:importin subunit beta-1
LQDSKYENYWINLDIEFKD